MTQFKKIVDFFLKKEEECSVSKFNFLGLEFYPHVRLRLFREYIHERGVFNQRISMKKYFNLGKIWIYLKSVVSICLYFFRPLSQSKIAVLSSKTDNGIIKNYVKDPEEILFIKMNFKSNKPIKRGYLYIDFVKITSKILSNVAYLVFRMIGIRNSDKENDFLQRFEESFQDKAKSLVGVYKFDFVIQYYLYKVILLKICYSNLSEVYIEASYLHFPMIKVLKEYGCKIYEIQHGVINNYHFGYNYNFSKPYFPDRMLVWGKYWKMYNYFNGVPTEIIGYTIKDKSLSDNEFKRKDNCLLIISQDTISNYLIDKFKKSETWLDNNFDQIYYKLHPKEYIGYQEGINSRYLWLREMEKNIDSIKVVMEEFDIYNLMGKCDYTVGVYSTAIFENFKYKSAINVLKLPGYEYMEGLEKYDVNFVDEFSDLSLGKSNIIQRDYIKIFDEIAFQI